LTFQLPWPHAEASGKGALSHDTDDPVPMLELRPDLNRLLASLVSDCKSARPETRPQSMDAVLQRLRPIKSERQ
jgi:hypothetical protein